MEDTVVACSPVLQSIFLERLEIDTKTLSQNGWSPGRKFNAEFPKHEAGEVLAWL
jgi:hypothetical protein